MEKNNKKTLNDKETSYPFSSPVYLTPLWRPVLESDTKLLSDSQQPTFVFYFY